MRFWDSSALVPLLVQEPASSTVRGWLETDPALAVWWATPVECGSALARLRRQEELTVEEESAAWKLLDILQDAWLEILPTDAVRIRARRLLRTHALRAAEALQLAAALVWTRDEGRLELVTFDERLALAAELEGFQVLGPGS